MNHFSGTQVKRRGFLRSLVAGGAALTMGAGARSFAASNSTACAALPEETSGPFPADGSTERVPSILAAPGIVRSDIRPSFGASSTVASGVALRLELTLLDLGRACQPLADSAVYLWNCDRDGEYSLYGRGLERENYLRGVQFTDGSGRVEFQTIFPACYAGRYPHLHLEVFKGKARALDARARILTTQLTAPREVCARVYGHAAGYTASAARFHGFLPAEDNVFASSSAAELALQTLAVTGDLEAGLTGRAAIGIRA